MGLLDGLGDYFTKPINSGLLSELARLTDPSGNGAIPPGIGNNRLSLIGGALQDMAAGFRGDAANHVQGMQNQQMQQLMFLRQLQAQNTQQSAMKQLQQAASQAIQPPQMAGANVQSSGAQGAPQGSMIPGASMQGPPPQGQGPAQPIQAPDIPISVTPPAIPSVDLSAIGKLAQDPQDRIDRLMKVATQAAFIDPKLAEPFAKMAEDIRKGLPSNTADPFSFQTPGEGVIFSGDKRTGTGKVVYTAPTKAPKSEVSQSDAMAMRAQGLATGIPAYDAIAPAQALAVHEITHPKPERQPVPGTDIPLPADVENQRIRMAQERKPALATPPSAPIVPNTSEFKVAQDLAYGKLTMSQFRSLYSYSRDVSKKQAIYEKAGELNPNFNPAAFEMGFTLAKNPKVQQQLSSMDNVVQAVPDLLKISDAAARSGVTALNKMIVPGGVAIGNKKFSNLETARTAFADELSGALGFGSATDMSREMGFNMTDTKLSPENFRSAIQDVVMPFVERKRATMLKQMGIYGQADMNPAASAPQASPAGVVKWGRDASGKPVRLGL